MVRLTLICILTTTAALAQEAKPKVVLPAKSRVVFKTDFPTPGDAALGENSLKGFLATIGGEESKFDPKFLPKGKAKSLFIVNGNMEFEYHTGLIVYRKDKFTYVWGSDFTRGLGATMLKNDDSWKTFLAR